MTEGYKPIFDAALEESTKIDYISTFPYFHDSSLFHFIVAPRSQYEPEIQTLELAKEIDNDIYSTLLAKGPSRLGNGSKTIDGVESRHILLMTFLIANLGSYLGNVVEIGGGYGNCLRLIADLESYDKWTIIDMDYILRLQKWFLTGSGVNLSQVDFIDSEDTLEELEPNLVIGTHSLSEFSLGDFTRYFELIKRSKWLFYVTHISSPNPELLNAKLDMIRTEFNLYKFMGYEDGNSVMFLLKNKND